MRRAVGGCARVWCEVLCSVTGDESDVAASVCMVVEVICLALTGPIKTDRATESDRERHKKTERNKERQRELKKQM